MFSRDGCPKGLAWQSQRLRRAGVRLLQTEGCRCSGWDSSLQALAHNGLGSM